MCCFKVRNSACFNEVYSFGDCCNKCFCRDVELLQQCDTMMHHFVATVSLDAQQSLELLDYVFDRAKDLFKLAKILETDYGCAFGEAQSCSNDVREVIGSIADCINDQLAARYILGLPVDSSQ